MSIQRAALLVVVAASLLTGCTPKKSGLPNAPVFNTGARATIIMPGQNAPPMPGQGSNVTQIGPGSYSGSRRARIPARQAARRRPARRPPRMATRAT